jgi:hypothetical protein
MSIKTRLEALERTLSGRHVNRGLRVVYQWDADDFASAPNWSSEAAEHYSRTDIDAWQHDGYTVLVVQTEAAL